MVELPTVATRLDEETGYREEITFIDVRETSVFCVTYVPRTPAPLGLVICPSILVEHLTNYRHEVMLARSLARRGVAVQRFHYRGTGHSGGEEGEVSLETMVEDTLALARRFRAQIGLTRIAFHGTRWGALVAGVSAASDPDAPLMFWEAVVDGSRYFRELIRGRLVREMKDERFAQGPADGWVQELAHQGRVDILGYPLYRTLFGSGQGQRLDQVLSDRGRTTLLVQLSRGNVLRPDFARLKDGVERAGGTCDVRIIHDEPAWFFPGHRMKSADTLVRVTAEWLAARAWRGTHG